MLQVLVVAALGYAGLVGVLYFAQPVMLFPGTALRHGRIDGPRPPERLVLNTPDGVTLAGVVLNRGAGPDLVLAFAGNAQNAEDLAQELAADLPTRQVAAFHYRGYGLSTGRPGERELLADALLIHDAVVARLRPERVFAAGFSLGSGVATHLSGERSLAGLFLVTPFDSIESVAAARYPWAPVRRLIRHRFRSDLAMVGNRTPTAIIAAAEDRIVVPERTEALAALVPNLVYRETLPGEGHSSFYDTHAYHRALNAAFAALDAPAARGATDATAPF